MNLEFWDFKDFLEKTTYDDREFLRECDFYKIPEIICAMKNSSGGWLILGAELDEKNKINITGCNKNTGLEKNYEHCYFYEPEKISVIKIQPSPWYKKPLNFNGKFLRRVENENLISNLKISSLIAGDSVEFSRDDFPAMNAPINTENINEFYETVINLNEEYKNFNHGEFLCRSFLFSGKYLTFACALMFVDFLKIRASLIHTSGHAEIEEHNLWNAYKNILPRLTKSLSEKCAAAFREAFINSLVHADYNIDNHIKIEITSTPPKVLFDNPGIIKNSVRNQRLMKIFQLMKIA